MCNNSLKWHKPQVKETWDEGDEVKLYGTFAFPLRTMEWRWLYGCVST